MTDAPFDLEAAAGAARGERWSFVFGGRTFVIAGDLSLDVLEAYSRFAREQLEAESADDAGLRSMAAIGAVLDALGGLFASDEDYRAFRDRRPGQAELVALLTEATRRATGGTLGEALPPSSSSDGDSAKPRPISAVTTG